MRVNELYKQVAQLGFEDSLEDDNRFYYAANRALLQVSALRPAISLYIINHAPLQNIIAGAGFAPAEKKTELCYEAQSPKAYYFEADGNGTAYIEKRESDGSYAVIGTVTLAANRTYKPYRGFIRDFDAFVTGAVRIRFVGEYIYHVKNIAMYGDIYSDDADDIPEYAPFYRYDIGRLTDDFLSLCSPPIKDDDARDRLHRDYDTENGRVILLPYDAHGCYEVRYRRRVTPIETDDAAQDNESEIDLDEELCALLPNLVAAYVWAEDEPNLAQYYLTLYQTSAADLEKKTRNMTPIYMKSANGW